MLKFELLLILIAVPLVAGALLWAFWDDLPTLHRSSSQPADGIQTKEGTDQLVKKQAATIEDSAQQFIDHYSKAIGKNNEEAAQAAKNLLSEHGRNVVETDVHPIDGLKRLTGNLDVPQKINSTQSRKQSDNFAELAVDLVYSDKNVQRYFYFTLENNEWKIDSIQEIQQ